MSNIQEEVFKAIDVISGKKVAATPYAYTINVRITSKPNNTTVFYYTALYQGLEIQIWAIGQSVYNIGDEVVVLVSNGKLSDKKFILG